MGGKCFMILLADFEIIQLSYGQVQVVHHLLDRSGILSRQQLPPSIFNALPAALLTYRTFVLGTKGLKGLKGLRRFIQVGLLFHNEV
jgi:hypothetical protein